MYTTAMPSAQFHERLLATVDAREDLTVQRHELVYDTGTRDPLRIASADITPEDPVMVVRGTIHGDEIAGALTVLNYLDDRGSRRCRTCWP